jgi:serralysin
MATTTGNDTFNVLRYGQTATWDALAGTDTVYFERVSYSTNRFTITKDSATDTIYVDSTSGASHNYHLTLKNVERLSFSNGSNVIDLTTMFASTTIGTSNADVLTGTAGNDTLQGFAGDDYIDGGGGNDTAVFNINQSAVTDIRPLKAGGTLLISSEGSDTLVSIETLSFLDGNTTISDLLSAKAVPAYSVTSDGISSTVSPLKYTGPVTFIEYSMLGSNVGDVVTGSSSNDFINLLGGDDAANGGLGDDVLDGGTGSNFLTGGGGSNTFFLDGRGGSNTWSTITDFVSGDQVNIWGWIDGTSKLLLTQDSGGANGYTGVTLHYDLNNDSQIDTSITFTGLTVDQLPSIQALSVAGNGYLLIG